MLPPPVRRIVRVSPTELQSPVWSRTRLIGGKGPYHLLNNVGSGIGKVPLNASSTLTGIARDCSTVSAMSRWYFSLFAVVRWLGRYGRRRILRSPGLVAADDEEHHRGERPPQQDVDDVVLRGVHERKSHDEHIGD